MVNGLISWSGEFAIIYTYMLYINWMPDAQLDLNSIWGSEPRPKPDLDFSFGPAEVLYKYPFSVTIPDPIIWHTLVYF